MTTPFTQLDAVLNILLIVTVIVLFASRLRIPYTIILIFAGLFAHLYPRFPILNISPDIFISLLLPPILFEETLKLNVEGLIEDSDFILSNAIAGTLIMVVAVALFAYFLSGFTFLEAFLLGVIIAPTDPVTVIATFRRLGVLRRFELIVAGESLLNDGVAIVVYSTLVSAISIGVITPLSILRISIVSVAGGVLIGLIGGHIVHLIFCWTDDKFVQVLLSFISAFGIFRTAEGLGASGVIATVLTGLIINYRCRKYGGISAESMEMLEALWEFVGFTASSIAFIFIGMYLDPALLMKFLFPVFLLTIFILWARYWMVDIIAETIKFFNKKDMPDTWRIGVCWSGLRGAISIVLVLGVSTLRLPNAEEMTALTYGVVLATSIIQGLTMPIMVRGLNLSTDGIKPIPPEEEIEQSSPIEIGQEDH
jgi:CPA1 family monovalent cation:H+ antiporter